MSGISRAVAVAGTIVALIALQACSPGTAPQPEEPSVEGEKAWAEPAEPAARVYVLGIDGASWTVLDPAMAAGVMPNLRRLVERGSRGVLKSMDPTASAILWTTLATGKKPEEHGILGFVVPSADPKPVPVTSNLRRVKALWNIASERGLTVGFVGWWVTWPAEKVRGFMATDYTWPLAKDARGFATGVNPELDFPGRTYPDELIRELELYNKVESRMDPAELDALGITAVPPVDGYAVRDMFLKDISLAAMMEPLLDDHDPDLFAIYFDGFDAYCHIFWRAWRDYSRARETSTDAVPEGDRALGRAMDLHLGRIDAALGMLMERAGNEGVVVVISDHGYGDNPDRAPIQRGFNQWIQPPHWHTLDGIIAASGGPIRSGAEISDASVLDVTPTILALLGLPVGEDMAGRALTEMIDDGFLAEHPVTRISTYEDGTRGDSDALESAYDEEALRRLRALGYID